MSKDHSQPFKNPRNPRPKGAQRGTGDGSAPSCCLIAMVAMPFLVTRGLLKQSDWLRKGDKRCGTCRGSGWHPSKGAPHPCPSCGGFGSK